MSDVMEPGSETAPAESASPAAPAADRPRKRKKKTAPTAQATDAEPVEPAPQAAPSDAPTDPPATDPPLADEPPQPFMPPTGIRLAPDDPPSDDGEAPQEDSDDDETAGDSASPSAIRTLTAEDGVTQLTTEQVVEAVLFGADTPLTPAKIAAILGTGSARDVRKHIDALNARYQQTTATFRIEKIAGGYQMLTLPAFNPWLKRLKQTRQESKLSQAAMETLAVVAYKQPVVRAEIEAIRGVAAGEMLSRLRELGLVKIVGRAEDVGRPLLYGTTRRFLDVFGLGSLEDLPTVEELKAPE